MASSDVRYFINEEEHDHKFMAEVGDQKYLIQPDPSIDPEWKYFPLNLKYPKPMVVHKNEAEITKEIF